MHDICDIYLNFDTITEVKYETEPMFPLPAITICFGKTYPMKHYIILLKLSLENQAILIKLNI